MMIWKYFKMKLKLFEMKLVCFSYMLKFLKDHEDIVDTSLRLVRCLRDVPMEELQGRFLNELVDLVCRKTDEDNG